MAQHMSGNYSYPLEETNGNARPPSKRQGSGDNGNAGYRDSKTVRRTPSDLYNVMSDSEETKQRRASLKAINSSSSRRKSRNTLREKETPRPQKGVDDSAWIHRDKLEEIEIREMEEAGIDVREARRSMSAGRGASARSSRSQSRTRRPMSRDRPRERVEEPYTAAYGDYEDFDRKRISTIPAAEEEDQDFDPHVDTELRTPEEVAAERDSIPSNMIRPSTSRIPISKASPVPVPQNVVGRDSPLPRSRNGSGAWSGNWDEMQYARKARSGSIGSQAVLDEDGMRTPSRPVSSYMNSSNESSPPKARLPNRTTPTSGARKGSLPNGGARPESSSGAKPRASLTNLRPASRSAHKSRPSTSHQHAPEGEAPWIAGMYKPDPRLPPEQQMLPTHAKRMLQEQWEKEGRMSGTGTAYDRDFRPLNNEQFPTQPPPKSASPAPPSSNLDAPQQTYLDHTPKLSRSLSPNPVPYPTERNGSSSPNSANMNAWPLTPQADAKSDTGSVRSGRYKTTPTITTPAEIQRSPSRQPDSLTQPHNPTPRVPDFDEKADVTKKKGGCGCCIVM